ncbi:Protein required for attachment to host cells [Variovorax sp. RA8]|nr:Protein required for attachment to host cells [Variovorax sp. RA8]
MKDQWILVANASVARLFRRGSASEALVPVETMTHRQSRLKGAELAHDRPGREANDNSRGPNRFEPRSDVRRKEHLRFAHEISERLEKGLAAGEFDSLLVFASSPFLGELRALLSERVEKHLKMALNNDLTALDMAEIEARLPRSWGEANLSPSR